MNSPEIDGAVLAVTQAHWGKVAMIIVKTAERLGPDLPEGDAGYSMIAARIAAWRHSEVRLP
jgi:hypothetical protein